MFKRLKDFIVPGAGIILCTGLLWKTYPSRVSGLYASYDGLVAPPLSELRPDIVNILTLGHKNIYDNFINIWLLQLLIDPDKSVDPERMMTAIRAVIRHTPKLETIYMLSCFTMYLDYKKPENCQEIILAGLQVFPQSWRLPMTQAFVHYFLLKEPAQAASFFQMAASRPNSPPYVQNLVQKLLSENKLDPEDVERSLGILGAHPANQEFVKILRSFGKMNETAPSAAQPSRE